MSLEIIKQEVENFLATDTPEVLAIKGAWGIGKTYFWQTEFEEAKNANKIKLQNYSYVSLFGLSTINDIRGNIFAEIKHINSISDIATPKTKPLANADATSSRVGKAANWLSKRALCDLVLVALRKTAELARYAVTFIFKFFKALFFQETAVFKQVCSPLIYFLKKIPNIFSVSMLIKRYAPDLRPMMLGYTKQTIICLDDIERKNRSVETQDLLGIISLLKERQGCKIIIIFNDNKLNIESKKEYEEFREKVIDKELEFNPTCEECVKIALDKTSEYFESLSYYIKKLNIKNIRIIKKAQNLAGELYDILKAYKPEVTERALATLCLEVYNFYIEKVERKEFQHDYCRTSSFYIDAGYAGKFDKNIADFVRKGFLNPENDFASNAQTYNDVITMRTARHKSLDEYERAWGLYANTLRNNQKEVVESLYTAFANNVKYLSQDHLNSVVHLFRELKEDKKATELINLYIKKHGDNNERIDIQNTDIDPEIKTAFNKRAKKEPSIADALLAAYKNREFSADDIEFLSQKTNSDFYDFFKANETSDDLQKYLLAYSSVNNTRSDGETQIICDNILSALRRFSDESLINRARLKEIIGQD